MTAHIHCPYCGYPNPLPPSLLTFDDDDLYPPPEILVCGDDDGGCYRYFVVNHLLGEALHVVQLRHGMGKSASA